MIYLKIIILLFSLGICLIASFHQDMYIIGLSCGIFTAQTFMILHEDKER